MELKNHVLARHSHYAAGCNGPRDFDCDQGDLHYVYQETPGSPLKALYLDNEGHVIHYSVSNTNCNERGVRFRRLATGTSVQPAL